MNEILERLVAKNREGIAAGTLLATWSQTGIPRLRYEMRCDDGVVRRCAIGIAMTDAQLAQVTAIEENLNKRHLVRDGVPMYAGISDLPIRIRGAATLEEMTVLQATQMIHDAWATRDRILSRVGVLPESLAAMFSALANGIKPINQDDYWKWLAEVEQWIRERNGQLSREDPV